MIICGEEIIQKTTNRTTEHEPCWFLRLESSAAESVEVLFPNPSMRMEVSIFTSASHFLKTPCRNDLNVASSCVEMDWIFWFSELWWGASHSLVLPPKNREYRTNMNKPCTLMRTMMTNHGIDFGDTVTTSSCISVESRRNSLWLRKTRTGLCKSQPTTLVLKAHNQKKPVLGVSAHQKAGQFGSHEFDGI